ncbi:GumC domain-containing protein [Actinomadura macrotermitis]|uniref:Polysaccharide chain length determinant N-terminal domain-containing protein n=1 Tax=Actinomadura macrotermitis TaxID=2585200 RepID=A0A7K0BS26_9ACTN|nr:hypothetical protein [Actinomadura macrotermitis]MQY04000.1 hypothetical protein [Actinomadura macrotermitis]
MTAQTPATPEISLVEAVWRYRLMSLLIVLASVLAAVAATQLLFSSVSATARFAVTDPTNNNNVLRKGVVSAQGYTTYTAQRAAFAGSAPVLARAAEIVKSRRGPALSGEALRGRVKTSSKPDGGVVLVTGTGGSGAEAALIANSVVQAYQEVTVSSDVARLDKQLKNMQATEKKITEEMAATQPGSRAHRLLAANLTKIQTQESGVLSARSNANDGVQFVDTADAADGSGSKLPQNAAIGFAIGLILACVISFLRAAARSGRGGAPAMPAAQPMMPSPALPAAPPVPAAPAISGPRLNGGAFNGNGAAPGGRAGRGKGAHARPSADGRDAQANSDLPIALWTEDRPERPERPVPGRAVPDRAVPDGGGDPTQTAEDLTGRIAESKKGEGKAGRERGAAKDDPAALIRYDLDK